MSTNVKILKDHEGFVSGQILSLRDKTATNLINKKIAELRGSSLPKSTTPKTVKKKATKAKKG